MKNQLSQIHNLIAEKKIQSVTFDIDGTLYPMKLIERSWWKNFFLNPIWALKFLSIRKKWEKRRKGDNGVKVLPHDVDFFENYLARLLHSDFVSSEMHELLETLNQNRIKIYFLSDHGAEVKLKALNLAGGIPLNCLKLTGELKPHQKISDLLVQELNIDPKFHLHVGDRWSDEEQARMLGCHFILFQ